MNYKNIFTNFIRVTASPGLLYFRPKRIYENENAKQKIKGGAVLIANHVSFIDPVYAMLIIWYRIHHFICIKELLNNKFNTFFLGTCCQCIPIDRENFGLDTFNEITEHLKNGELVSMYPEGHVNLGEEKALNGFKSGMVLMALRANVPIVPLYIKPRKKWYDRLVGVIGEPIYVDQVFHKRPNMREIDQIAVILHEKEQELERMANL